jgi:hypothetical protein
MAEKSSGGNLQEGLSEQQSLDKAYEPRKSGQGERPVPPKGENCGKFTIK